jgi:phenylalanyl-tRNA synthetase beta chain
MTISYNWLCDYLPVKPEPAILAGILSSIGLEVESLEKYAELKGGLSGLIIGEVLEVKKHPGADKLSLTKVDTGSAEILHIVCGAPNVAPGQKVIVAPVGTTIYPINGEPMAIKAVNIRGENSEGMICAEDEIGIGTSHEGIMVLPPGTPVGIPASDYFQPYEDHIFEIGLTPNRSDAMSHLGVARDICAYFTHHDENSFVLKTPFPKTFERDHARLTISVRVENTQACARYSGISITGVTVKESPIWMQQRLKAIGIRPINNIVDITNYVLHETGQPLHAFDADEIGGKAIVVKNLPSGTVFTTLDEKQRKLDSEDLMICDADENGMCIGGVFGGLGSGVKESTKNIFLESAWFNPINIRKSSIRHNLRTEAAMHFEKGVDISNTTSVLKRAALLIKEYAGGAIASEIVDVYPFPKEKKEVTLKFAYLKKLSGKDYYPDAVKSILESLGFSILKRGSEGLSVAVPFHKTDISIPADIVEEIMRIDGFDNIAIPSSITISPSVEELDHSISYKSKISGVLVGLGFHEILTNSITNSAFLSEEESMLSVKMINNLSAELNVMRTSMMETGLQSIAHNLNRKNNNLRFFEFGKTYSLLAEGQYEETDHLAIFLTGKKQEESWKKDQGEADLFFLKGVTNVILAQAGLQDLEFFPSRNDKLRLCLVGKIGDQTILQLGLVERKILERFDIKQDVWIADFFWGNLILANERNQLSYRELTRFPSVQRDLALVVDKNIRYEFIKKTALAASVGKLSGINLFDVFESEKLGQNKKSVAISFTFQDEEKTLTDIEIDSMMKKIIITFEKELQAEIRK